MLGRALPSRLFALAVCTMSACSSEPEGPGLDALQCQQARIYYGSDAPEALELDPGQRMSIVAVYPDDREAICSGVVVADGVVVTARHCVEGHTLESLNVGTWSSTGWQATVRDAEVHPVLDVAVVWIDPDDTPRALDPIPLLERALDDHWLGAHVELAGHGATEFGELGQLRFATEPIVALNANTIVVDGHGDSGACNGDSGGPLLAYDDEERVRVIGILDSGHTSCVRDDHYTRVDVLAHWWPFDWTTPDTSDGCW